MNTRLRAIAVSVVGGVALLASSAAAALDLYFPLANGGGAGVYAGRLKNPTFKGFGVVVYPVPTGGAYLTSADYNLKDVQAAAATMGAGPLPGISGAAVTLYQQGGTKHQHVYLFVNGQQIDVIDR